MMDGPYISVAVEGESDTGMVRPLLAHVGISLAQPCLVKRGVANLDRLIPGLDRTTIDNPWVVFRDSDGQCPVELRTTLIDSRPHDGGFELRFACSMTEAWLLADAENFSAHFKIPVQKIPKAPDELPHVKRELLRLCRSSRSRRIRDDMVRTNGAPGALYTTRLNEFALERWNVVEAQERSPSLRRTIVRLEFMRDLLLTVSAADTSSLP